MQVPFLDLKKHHDPIRDEVLAAIAQVIESSALPEGLMSPGLRRPLLRFAWCPHAIGLGSEPRLCGLRCWLLGLDLETRSSRCLPRFIATSEASVSAAPSRVSWAIDEET